MPKAELRGAWALVTGGGTRVGAAICRELVEAGCNLLVHYGANERGAASVVELARSAGCEAFALQADLLDRRQIQALAIEVTERTGGRLHLLVNNAANFERVVPEALTEGHWDRAMALNATAPYLLTLGLSESLRSARGSMIAIACVSSIRPWKNFIPYGTSKAALVHLVRGLALGLAPEVRVNAVAPGAAMIPGDYDDKKQARLRRRIPLDRFGEAGDVARAVRFLAENDYITGHLLAVDGGLSLA